MDNQENWLPDIRISCKSSMNHISHLSIRGYQHSHPIKEVNYFTPTMTNSFWGLKDPLRSEERPLGQSNTKPLLLIGMAFYNEEPIELRRTLASLVEQVADMESMVETQVVVVSDGHAQMHPDTKKYLRALFSKTKTDEEQFDELYASLDRYVQDKVAADEDERIGTPVQERKKAPPPLTYVVQRVLNDQKEGGGGEGVHSLRILGSKTSLTDRLKLTLVLKSLNRRKHNSQEWMFSIARSLATDFIFLTDCGTLFRQGCLPRLVSYMIANEKCVGCTGRQRVMSAADQDCEDEGITEKFFRLVQTADYEGSYATYTGAFSLIGCLPVLPGPCCMMRYRALTIEREFRSIDPLDEVIASDVINSEGEESVEDVEYEGLSIQIGSPSDEGLQVRPQKECALEHFTQLITTPPRDTNLVIENVKLAEDRIPSYAILTHGAPGSYTTWVDGSVFDFQAETDIEAFAKQRRRWINGALFSYIWLALMKTHLLLRSSHSRVRVYIIWMMFLLQLFTYGLGKFLIERDGEGVLRGGTDPLIAIISPSIFASGFFLGLISLFGNTYQTPIIIATCIFSGYTYAFVWVHRYRAFVKPLWFFMVVFNVISMVLTVAGYIHQASAWGFSPDSVDRLIIQWMILVIMLIPFVMAFISLDFKSLWLLIKSSIPYWLFLPTLVGSFTLYSMARLSDTSWGNRVSTTGSNFKSATQFEVAQSQQELSNSALVALIAITIVNGFLEFFLIFYGVNSWFIVGVISFVFASTAVQAFVSVLYFMGKHLSGLTCLQRGNRRCCCMRRGQTRLNEEVV